ncbi:unnamed protein product [Closterium sp. Naga37s-1]|nr:unnamed protein product [Closterium sp. Naga37s-1]
MGVCASRFPLFALEVAHCTWVRGMPHCALPCPSRCAAPLSRGWRAIEQHSLHFACVRRWWRSQVRVRPAASFVMQPGGRSTSGGGGARTYESDQRRSPAACFVMQPGSSCTSGGGQGAGAGMRGGVEMCAFVAVEGRKDRAHVAHPQGKSAQAQGEADAVAQGRGNTVEVVAALALITRLSCGPVASRSCGIVASLSCGIVANLSCGIVASLSCGIVASLSLTAFAPVLVPLAASLAPHLPLHHSVRPSAHFHSSVPYPCVPPCLFFTLRFTQQARTGRQRSGSRAAAGAAAALLVSPSASAAARAHGGAAAYQNTERE